MSDDLLVFVWCFGWEHMPAYDGLGRCLGCIRAWLPNQRLVAGLLQHFGLVKLHRSR